MSIIKPLFVINCFGNNVRKRTSFEVEIVTQSPSIAQLLSAKISRKSKCSLMIVAERYGIKKACVAL